MRLYQKVTLSYLLFGILWILITDIVAYVSTPHLHAFALVGLIKGWFYVLVSAVVIFILTRSAFRQHELANQEKLEIFRSTISGAHHVLLNYLNQMQLVTLEAEKHKDFDQNIVELSKSLSEQAAFELSRIGEIQHVSPDSINQVVYQDLRKKH